MARTVPDYESTDPAELAISVDAQADHVVKAASAEIREMAHIPTPELQKKIASLDGVQEQRVLEGRIDPMFAKSELVLAGALYHRNSRRIGEMQTAGNHDAAESSRRIAEGYSARVSSWKRIIKGEPTEEDAKVALEDITWHGKLGETRLEMAEQLAADESTQPDRTEHPGRRPEDRIDPRVQRTRDDIDRARQRREHDARDRTDRGYRSR